MSANTTAAKGRRTIAKIMVDTCRIYRRAEGVLNTTTGVIAVVETDIYVGPCRVKPVPSIRTGGEEVGETLVAHQSPIISIPLSEAGVRAGDRVHITSSADGDLTDANRIFLIRLVQGGTHITARRLICQALE